MPSPIVHVAAGYAVYRAARAHRSKTESRRTQTPIQLFLPVLALSLLPDVDSVLGILLGNFGAFHNNLSHSLTFGLAVAFCIGGLVWLRNRSGFRLWFSLALLSYWLHLLLDLFTIGRGLMILWPVSSARYDIPFKLFYGLRWSDGLISVSHLWTVASELGLLFLVVAVAYAVARKSRGVSAAPTAEGTSPSGVHSE